jgi:hypothetical protein
MSIPPESLWVQYSIIGILTLVIMLATIAAWRFWRELLNWLDMQNAQRDAERDKQRTWQGQEAEKADARWQTMIMEMQSAWLKQDGENAALIKEMTIKLDELKIAINAHDTYVKASRSKG